MKLLLVDTSTQDGAIAMWLDGILNRTISWSSKHNHATELMPAIESLINAASLRVQDLDGIVVAQGPGGFSSLRAGISVSKGLAYAGGIPIVGVSSLEAVAYPSRDLGFPVVGLMAAGSGAVAWARFRQRSSGWVRLSRDKVSIVDEILGMTGRHLLLAGEGADSLRDRFEHALGPKAHFMLASWPIQRLLGLGQLGAIRLAATGSNQIADVTPRYLRPPGITPAKPPKRIG